ncbi:hypothetical protein BVX99_02560 [bacterium F16]|nr:hypothetical protein BVX99_02560 [bacterium F16]
MSNGEPLVIKNSKSGTIISLFIVIFMGAVIGLDAYSLGEVNVGRHVAGLVVSVLAILYLLFLLSKSTVLVTCTRNGIVLPIYQGTIAWSKVCEIRVGKMSGGLATSHSAISKEQSQGGNLVNGVYISFDDSVFLPVSRTKNFDAYARTPQLYAFSTAGLGKQPEEVVEMLKERLEASQ